MLRWLPLAILVVAAAGSLGHGDGGCCDDHDEEEAQYICDGSEDALTPGTAESGSTYTIAIVSATPAEHAVQGEDDAQGEPTGRNKLVVSITDAADAPVTGATFTKIEPYTARHDHGTPVLPMWTELGGGEYEITDINYIHRGPWRVTMELDVAGTLDTIAFVFCIRDYDFEDAGAQ